MVAVGVCNSGLLERDPTLASLVDFVELPGWSLADFEERPHDRLILHNLDLDWSLAAPDIIGPEWEARLVDAIEWTGSPWFSMHLAFSCEHVRCDGHMLPESDPLSRVELFSRVVHNVRCANARSPVPLILENLDYCPEGAYEHICEPSFIRAVLEETDTGLLLDIGHLQVSASWFGLDPESMLDGLSMERVREIHVSSPRPLDNAPHLLDDGHERLIERDIACLRSVLFRSQPEAITIEYRHDSAVLREQIREIRAVAGG